MKWPQRPLTKAEITCKRKKRYHNDIRAKMALGRIQSSARNDPNEPHKVPVRAYRCPTCRGWHLTSIPAPEPL